MLLAAVQITGAKPLLENVEAREQHLGRMDLVHVATKRAWATNRGHGAANRSKNKHDENHLAAQARQSSMEVVETSQTHQPHWQHSHRA